ncbi:MAG: transposase, partial [Holophaga sp.]|nr:transposase [Holophaga sp.]
TLDRSRDPRLAEHPEGEPTYRLITTILDPKAAPAKELAALYTERWEIEAAFDELKTHLRGRQMLLRSKTPDLVRQEFYGLLLAHFAIRGLMHEAAVGVEVDPDRLSFVHAVRVVKS